MKVLKRKSDGLIFPYYSSAKPKEGFEVVEVAGPKPAAAPVAPPPDPEQPVDGETEKRGPGRPRKTE